MQTSNEVFVSVDVETAGPYPGRYSLLSIGACLVSNPATTFYVELQPLSLDVVPDALTISGLSLEGLSERGLPPADAMLRFAAWIESVASAPARPIFVGFNAPFDWMFINDYFHRFLGYNPFGHNALDIKAFYAGRTGAVWSETTIRDIAARYGGLPSLSHHAQADAIDQAGLMRSMLEERPLAGERRTAMRLEDDDEL